MTQVQAIEAIGKLESYRYPGGVPRRLFGPGLGDVVDFKPIVAVFLSLVECDDPDVIAAIFSALQGIQGWVRGYTLPIATAVKKVLEKPDVPAHRPAKIEAAKTLRYCGPDEASIAVPILGRLLIESRDDPLRLETARTLRN